MSGVELGLLYQQDQESDFQPDALHQEKPPVAPPPGDTTPEPEVNTVHIPTLYSDIRSQEMPMYPLIPSNDISDALPASDAQEPREPNTLVEKLLSAGEKSSSLQQKISYFEAARQIDPLNFEAIKFMVGTAISVRNERVAGAGRKDNLLFFTDARGNLDENGEVQLFHPVIGARRYMRAAEIVLTNLDQDSPNEANRVVHAVLEQEIRSVKAMLPPEPQSGKHHRTKK